MVQSTGRKTKRTGMADLVSGYVPVCSEMRGGTFDTIF